MSAETQLQRPTSPATRHPLEPLSAEEIAATSAILVRERSLSEAVSFVQPARTEQRGGLHGP